MRKKQKNKSISNKEIYLLISSSKKPLKDSKKSSVFDLST